MKHVATILNNEEWEIFAQWAKKNGFVKPDGQINVYKALKNRLDPESLKNDSSTKAVFQEVPMTEKGEVDWDLVANVSDVEKIAELIDKMPKKELVKANEKFNDSKKTENTIRKKSLYGANSLKWKYHEFIRNSEDPMDAIWELKRFVIGQFLVERLKGRSTLAVLAEYKAKHRAAGRIVPHRKYTSDVEKIFMDRKKRSNGF